MKQQAYAILVVDEEGNADYLCDGMGNTVTRFGTYAEAEKFKSFLEIGMEEGISIVKYPNL